MASPSAGGWPTLEARARDDSEAVGTWVSRRLAQLARDEQAELGAARMSNHDVVDVASWSVQDVSEWLQASVGFAEDQVEALRSQGISGLELSSLDDLDLRVLGITSLPERKRILRMLHELRARAQRAPSGTGTLAQQKLARMLETKRRRLSVLGECNAKVLATTPAIPLRTRRLLAVLWHQMETVGQDAISQIEQDDVQRRKREGELGERARRSCRRALEVQMAACAAAEDRMHQAQEKLRIEQQKLGALREAMADEAGLGAAAEEVSEERAFSKEIVSLLVPSDFAAHEIFETKLTESFERMARDIEAVASDAEIGGQELSDVLEAAGAVVEQIESEAQQLAEREKKVQIMSLAASKHAVAFAAKEAEKSRRHRKIVEGYDNLASGATPAASPSSAGTRARKRASM